MDDAHRADSRDGHYDAGRDRERLSAARCLAIRVGTPAPASRRDPSPRGKRWARQGPNLRPLDVHRVCHGSVPHRWARNSAPRRPGRSMRPTRVARPCGPNDRARAGFRPLRSTTRERRTRRRRTRGGRTKTSAARMAGAPGFEPGMTGPKPVALPLGYAPIRPARRGCSAPGGAPQPFRARPTRRAGRCASARARPIRGRPRPSRARAPRSSSCGASRGRAAPWTHRRTAGRPRSGGNSARRP